MLNSAQICNSLNLYTPDTKATNYIMPAIEFLGKQIPNTNAWFPHDV